LQCSIHSKDEHAHYVINVMLPRALSCYVGITTLKCICKGSSLVWDDPRIDMADRQIRHLLLRFFILLTGLCLSLLHVTDYRHIIFVLLSTAFCSL
jgi:hypothetical protein